MKDFTDYESFYFYPCSEGHYKVSDALVQKTPLVPVSCFKSTTARIQPPVRNNIPGPGTYNPYQPPEPVKRTVLPYVFSHNWTAINLNQSNTFYFMLLKGQFP